MVTTLPVPIEFSLPPGWHSVPPDTVNARDTAFVALHPASGQDFTANITISGEVREAGVPLTRIADEAVERLRQGDPGVELGRRNEVGEEDNPGLTQAVRFSLPVNGITRQVVQFQVFLSMEDTRDPRRRAVLHIVLSALPDQFAQVIGDFQQFIATIRPEQRKT